MATYRQIFRELSGILDTEVTFHSHLKKLNKNKMTVGKQINNPPLFLKKGLYWAHQRYRNVTMMAQTV